MGALEKSDVVYMYSHARDKHEEISILAELTASDIETIIEVLKEAEQPIEGKYIKCKSCGFLMPGESKSPLCPKCRYREKMRKRDLRRKGKLND